MYRKGYILGLFLNIMLLLVLIHTVVNSSSSYPTIEITFDEIGPDKGIEDKYYQLGEYFPLRNHIRVSTLGNMEATLLHEYGHYIQKRITRAEMKEWETLCPSEPLPQYAPEEWCDEWFAFYVQNVVIGINIEKQYQQFFESILRRYM